MNYSVTENGALGYASSGSAIVDLNYNASSLRSKSDAEIVEAFKAAADENFVLAVLWLFFARDCRGGMGERNLFRVCMRYLANNYPVVAGKLIKYIPEFGRWDDLFCLFDTMCESKALNLIVEQLSDDFAAMVSGKSVSLLAKWLPSENASCVRSKKRAKIIRRRLQMSSEEYRKMLSALRKQCKIVESQMSANKWNEIAYAEVPSKANLIYRNAFMRHDEERRTNYLDRVESGEEKMNASVLFPYEIVSKYGYGNGKDSTLESAWKNLPAPSFFANMIVVADGSGSMLSRISNKTNVMAWDVATSLAIYFSQFLRGQFKDKYIEFSSVPQFVDLSNAKSLVDKILIAHDHDDCSNTNIEAVFDMILYTAQMFSISQADVPDTVLIVSDMEFDMATNAYEFYDDAYDFYGNKTGKTLFETIREKWDAAGYKMPRLVFWNVCGRTGTVPLTENENGVVLVSGFSANIADMVMSGSLDPMEALLGVLKSDRYKCINDEVQGALNGK